MESDVTECCGTQQGVAEGVDEDIAVGMCDATLCVRDLNTPQNEPQSLLQYMDIIAVSDSEIRHNLFFAVAKVRKKA